MKAFRFRRVKKESVRLMGTRVKSKTFWILSKNVFYKKQILSLRVLL